MNDAFEVDPENEVDERFEEWKRQANERIKKGLPPFPEDSFEAGLVRFTIWYSKRSHRREWNLLWNPLLRNEAIRCLRYLFNEDLIDPDFYVKLFEENRRKLVELYG